MAKKPDVEGLTRTTNKAGADVVVTKNHTEPYYKFQAYCHGCTELSRPVGALPEATSWAQNHATVCNFA